MKYSYLLLVIGFLFFHSCTTKTVSQNVDCANSRQVANAPTCGELFEESSKENSDLLFENLKDVNYKSEVFPNGKTYRKYTFTDLEKKANSPEYKKFLEETAEVIFEPGGVFGHIVLRVGKKVYSFDYINSTTNENFRFRRLNNVKGSPKAQGFIFKVGKKEIRSKLKKLENFYRSSAYSNVPGFDAYTSWLEIDRPEEGRLAYKSPAPEYGNNDLIEDSKVYKYRGKKYLKSSWGVKVPVYERDGKEYTLGYSCSSSAAYVMQNFFGIKLINIVGSQEMTRSLEAGNTYKYPPIAIIEYSK